MVKMEDTRKVNPGLALAKKYITGRTVDIDTEMSLEEISPDPVLFAYAMRKMIPVGIVDESFGG
jgi:hypothetical protein